MINIEFNKEDKSLCYFDCRFLMRSSSERWCLLFSGNRKDFKLLKYNEEKKEYKRCKECITFFQKVKLYQCPNCQRIYNRSGKCDYCGIGNDSYYENFDLIEI
jgi:hypothetical protein